MLLKSPAGRAVVSVSISTKLLAAATVFKELNSIETHCVGVLAAEDVRRE